MMPVDFTDKDISKLAKDMRARGEPFAIATVVRTLGATAAKPGAKALLNAQGVILQGWIGGGCVRNALAKATQRAMADGAPQLVSLHPQDLLDEKGITAGEDIEGVRFARNGCPSKGSMDIFVELVLPLPELRIYGDSLVAQSLAHLAAQFQWAVSHGTADTTAPALGEGDMRMIVVATQGKSDLDCLKAALNSDSSFIAFVGSRKKFAVLSERLVADGLPQETVAQIQAPAGLAIGAVTPDEIALSILAQLTSIRRHDQRHQGGDNE
ncbi:xanthine dehydrogenase accessory protein XdhC [Thalassovita gelatinovora]|uniref:Xanthine dehydrogenase accessory protein XdhC n=1 Tax=Thalassovita gelatinovora TaxID=53501 RepID=A0A0P1FUA1_THAGE|nr:XdhC family protein [Thalassovita gelatinovora]QIZ80998.1 XdhC family protein [Thalassovita gelatinovora]CUH63545.1 xanthine dehydrogenase accessory protein XdhC [Thalassovita gelatinovora]SEQ69024.1 xanthine dehydrogenase accessory factor [Thalassovita gelatinovora]